MAVRTGLGRSRKEKLEAELARMLEVLKQTDAERVILFGSMACGRVHRGSDLDLIIVAPSSEPFVRRADKYYEALSPRVALDLLVYTPEEFARLRHTNPFVARAVREGRVLLETG